MRSSTLQQWQPVGDDRSGDVVILDERGEAMIAGPREDSASMPQLIAVFTPPACSSAALLRIDIPRGGQTPEVAVTLRRTPVTVSLVDRRGDPIAGVPMAVLCHPPIADVATSGVPFALAPATATDQAGAVSTELMSRSKDLVSVSIGAPYYETRRMPWDEIATGTVQLVVDHDATRRISLPPLPQSLDSRRAFELRIAKQVAQLVDVAPAVGCELPIEAVVLHVDENSMGPITFRIVRAGPICVAAFDPRTLDPVFISFVDADSEQGSEWLPCLETVLQVKAPDSSDDRVDLWLDELPLCSLSTGTRSESLEFIPTGKIFAPGLTQAKFVFRPSGRILAGQIPIGPGLRELTDLNEQPGPQWGDLTLQLDVEQPAPPRAYSALLERQLTQDRWDAAGSLHFDESGLARRPIELRGAYRARLASDEDGRAWEATSQLDDLPAGAEVTLQLSSRAKLGGLSVKLSAACADGVPYRVGIVAQQSAPNFASGRQLV